MHWNCTEVYKSAGGVIKSEGKNGKTFPGKMAKIRRYTTRDLRHRPAPSLYPGETKKRRKRDKLVLSILNIYMNVRT